MEVDVLDVEDTILKPREEDAARPYSKSRLRKVRWQSCNGEEANPTGGMEECRAGKVAEIEWQDCADGEGK